MSKKLEKILEHQGPNTGSETCTLWYDELTGKIYGVGDSNPIHDKPGIHHETPVHLLYDRLGARPQPCVKGTKITKALKKALYQILEYRLKKTPKS